MKKYFFPIVLAVPLALTACSGTTTEEPTPEPSSTAAETTSEAPTGPVEVELGKTINLTQDANGARDIALTIDDITISDQCHTGLNGHTDEPEDGGYYIRMIGEMDVKQSQTNFSFSETSLTALDEENFTIEVTPAFACNPEYDDMEGFQGFDNPIDEGQKARGVLEFWVADVPEKLSFTEPYEPLTWVWEVPESDISKGENATEQVPAQEAPVEESQAAVEDVPAGEEHLQNESWYSSPDNPALAEYYAEQERLAQIPYADGGTCPAYKCGYGTNDQGQRNPSSGEIQTLHGCQDGYITDAELCGAVGWVETHEY